MTVGEFETIILGAGVIFTGAVLSVIAVNLLINIYNSIWGK